MDWLSERNKIVTKSRTTIANNTLVLIAYKDSKLLVLLLANLGKVLVNSIAIGHPNCVPAEIYAKDALQATNKWDQLSDALVCTQDVRQALTYVETKNAEIYESDAPTSTDLRIVAKVDANLYEEILYNVAIIRGVNIMS